MVLLALAVGGLVLVVLIFFFMKSSKELPKNWSQLVSEIRVQQCGTIGIAEDILLRRRNKVALSKQPGKIALLTGGNRGIGLRIVKKLVECDIEVILGVRNPDQAKKAVETYLEHSKVTEGAKLHYEQLDIGSMKSVREFATKIQGKFDKIHILINNAGVMGVPYKLTEEGYESHMAINYYGHFLLTHLLLPQLRAAGTPTCRARIVNVSSCVNKIGEINYEDINRSKDYYPADAYNQSKLAQVLFAKHTNLQFVEDNEPIQSHSVHPGVVNTDLFEHSSTTYVPWVRQLLFKSPEEGARTVVYAAIAPQLEGKGGTYLSNCQVTTCHRHWKNSVQCEKLFRLTCDTLDVKDFFRKQSQ
ncbi:dehydrogenase/reductase SDR family member on chromosome X [Toxorhynchites rutilus septentrionalis]|uniref:dehydrogenase/reductase SDR family member on chromosome X n=1 Tax=Toxorhynchites rutilus septentrionalis TaxID=329112 RepID=UPI002478678A|nr:dehydrogenase/reductase SDR family member on chromosome X [Toxorhynchites rutilus septentrionalis]XP_055629129.1 dehydrogenase/reductase SDR family member on chromosome X [Toxorhynchites rutilus septentrionalis]